MVKDLKDLTRMIIINPELLPESTEVYETQENLSKKIRRISKKYKLLYHEKCNGLILLIQENMRIKMLCQRCKDAWEISSKYVYHTFPSEHNEHFYRSSRKELRHIFEIKNQGEKKINKTKEAYYCKCGAKLVTDWEWIYEGNTRRKELRQICSQFPCKHSGHSYGTSYIEGNYFMQECDRCGKIEKNIIVD